MELKQARGWQLGKTGKRFNRTFMELKPIDALNTKLNGMF